MRSRSSVTSSGGMGTLRVRPTRAGVGIWPSLGADFQPSVLVDLARHRGRHRLAGRRPADPDQASGRIGQAIQGVIQAAQPPGN